MCKKILNDTANSNKYTQLLLSLHVANMYSFHTNSSKVSAILTSVYRLMAKYLNRQLIAENIDISNAEEVIEAISKGYIESVCPLIEKAESISPTSSLKLNIKVAKCMAYGKSKFLCNYPLNFLQYYCNEQFVNYSSTISIEQKDSGCNLELCLSKNEEIEIL